MPPHAQVFVPLAKLKLPKYYDLCTTEVFGPVQVS